MKNTLFRYVFNEYFDLFICRSVLVADLEDCVFWTPTGLLRTLPTNTLRLSWWIFIIMPSPVILRSTGFASTCTSIVNCVAWPLPARALVVLARDTVTPRPLVDPVVLPGGERTASTCTGSVKFQQIFFCENISNTYIAAAVLLNSLVSFYLYYCVRLRY